MIIVPLSLMLVFMLLYLAFRSLLDALVVLANVLELSLGGIWALFLTGTNFSIAAAVGFTSIFGVAIMDGLLLVSSFNQLRHEGLPLRAAIMQGAERRVRPVDDDGADGYLRTVARRDFDEDRRPVAKAAGDRGRRQHAGNAGTHPLSDAHPL